MIQETHACIVAYGFCPGILSFLSCVLFVEVDCTSPFYKFGLLVALAIA
jgi:hypothetical protein